MPSLVSAVLLALTVARGDAKPKGPAAELASSGDFRSPMVLLTSEGSHSEVVDGVKIATGMAISPTRVVVSTRGLSIALAVTSGDVTAPTRLAKKLTSSALQQRWKIFSSSGVAYTGKLVLVPDDSSVAVIDLAEPIEDYRPCEGMEGGTMSSATMVGVDSFLGSTQILEIPVSLVQSSEKGAVVTTPLPRRFEGAMAVDDDGRCLGFVINVTGPGAARLVSPEAIISSVRVQEQEEARPEVRWSVGVGFGRVMDNDLEFLSPITGRLDLIIDRRWDLALEGFWQTFRDSSLKDDPTYLETRNRRRRFPLALTVGHLFGPRASLMRVGVVAGGALDIELNRTKRTTLTLDPECVVGQPCNIKVDQSTTYWQRYGGMVMLGMDIAALGKGPLKSLAGVRLSYRSGVALPDPSRSLHWLLVTVSF